MISHRECSAAHLPLRLQFETRRHRKAQLKLQKREREKTYEGNFKAVRHTSVRVSVSISTHYAATVGAWRVSSVRFAAPDCYQCTRYAVVLVFRPMSSSLQLPPALCTNVCMCVCVCVLAKSNEPLAVGNKGLDMPHATCHRPQYAYNMSARISLQPAMSGKLLALHLTHSSHFLQCPIDHLN